MLALAGEAKRNSGEPRPQIIHRERKWFEGAAGGAINIGGSRISASRWVGHAGEPCEQESEIEADCHVIGVSLRPMTDVTLFAAGKLISTGHMPRGSMRVNEPGLLRRGIGRALRRGGFNWRRWLRGNRSFGFRLCRIGRRGRFPGCSRPWTTRP